MKRGVSSSLRQSRMGPMRGTRRKPLGQFCRLGLKQPLQRGFGRFSSRRLIAFPRLYRELFQAAAELHGQLLADAFTVCVLVRRDQFLD